MRLLTLSTGEKGQITGRTIRENTPRTSSESKSKDYPNPYNKIARPMFGKQRKPTSFVEDEAPEEKMKRKKRRRGTVVKELLQKTSCLQRVKLCQVN